MTSRYHGSTISDDNKINDDGDGKENGKNNMFISTKITYYNHFARASRYFVLFFAVVTPLYDMKLLNFKSPLYGVHNSKIVAFFF